MAFKSVAIQSSDNATNNVQSATNNVHLPKKMIAYLGGLAQMENFEELEVVASNDLLWAMNDMSAFSLKIFELAISVRKGSEANFSNKMVFNLMSSNKSKNRYAKLKDCLDAFAKECIFYFEEQSGKRLHRSGVLEIEWNLYDPNIKVTFADWILEYLEGFTKGNFTKYALSEIVNLHGKYTLTIYNSLIMQFNKNKNIKYKTLDPLDIRFYVKDLRALTRTTDKYSAFTNFEKRVLKEAVDEINEKTSINVEYEKIRLGREISQIKFSVVPKKIAQEKAIQPRLSKEERDKKRATNAGNALSSEYTKILLETMLLGYQDLTDTYLLSRLWEDLYPLYDSVKNYQKIKEHILYTAKKYHGQFDRKPINDLVGYMITCFKKAQSINKI